MIKVVIELPDDAKCFSGTAIQQPNENGLQNVTLFAYPIDDLKNKTIKFSDDWKVTYLTLNRRKR